MFLPRRNRNALIPGKFRLALSLWGQDWMLLVGVAIGVVLALLSCLSDSYRQSA